MKYQYKVLCIISLSLFSVTLIKLFTYHISNIPAGGKLVAFFCLGVLLLIISFMYQRLRKIIIEDEKSHILNYTALFLILQVGGTPVAAQENFSFKATLDSVVQNSFYAVRLPPAVVAACHQLWRHTDKRNIR